MTDFTGNNAPASGSATVCSSCVWQAADRVEHNEHQLSAQSLLSNVTELNLSAAHLRSHTKAISGVKKVRDIQRLKPALAHNSSKPA